MSWHDPDREDTTIYKVVVNHEEQYARVERRRKGGTQGRLSRLY
jgi:hypothetical protein